MKINFLSLNSNKKNYLLRRCNKVIDNNGQVFSKIRIIVQKLRNLLGGRGGGHQKITLDYRGEVKGVQKGLRNFWMVPYVVAPLPPEDGTEAGYSGRILWGLQTFWYPPCCTKFAYSEYLVAMSPFLNIFHKNNLARSVGVWRENPTIAIIPIELQ